MEIILIKALQLIFCLSLLVFIHEGGHFLFAKFSGVKVEKFYLFFNPYFHIFSTRDKWFTRLFPYFKDNETEYGIGWLPLGGYVSIAGIGFDALVAHKFSTTQTRGLQAYTEVILSEYPFYKPSVYRLNIDGKEMERKALFISFANSNQFGYNTVVAPSASLNDGLIDVCIVELIPLIHMPIIAHLVLAHKFDLSQHVEIIKAKSIKVYNNDYEWVNLDGEAVKMGKEIDIKINNKKLNIICPHGKEK